MKIVNRQLYIQQYVYDNIESIVSKLKDKDWFDEDKFNTWLRVNNVEYKSNPSAYVNKCFEQELKNGRFKINSDEQIAVNLTSLYQAMKEKGVTPLNNKTFFIEEANEYILKNKILTLEKLKELNHKIVDYISKLEKPTSEDYINYLKRSNTLKGKIDWSIIQGLADKDEEEWQELMTHFTDL